MLNWIRKLREKTQANRNKYQSKAVNWNAQRHSLQRLTILTRKADYAFISLFWTVSVCTVCIYAAVH